MWNKLFLKEIVNNLRFDETLFSQEDMDFTMKYLEKCKNVFIQSQNIIIIGKGENL